MIRLEEEMIDEIELIIRRAMSGATEKAMYDLRHDLGDAVEMAVGKNTEAVLRLLKESKLDIGATIESAIETELKEQIMIAIITIKRARKLKKK